MLVKYLGVSTFDLKQAVLAGLGFVVSLGGRKIDYDSFFTAPNQSLRDRLISVYLNRRYYLSGESDKLAMNREKFWGGTAGVRWHAGVGARNDLIEFRRYVREFAAALSPATVVEIGCGNGTQLVKLADEIDGPERFIGVDLSPNQIEVCRKANKNPKVHFYAADGVSWIKQNMAIGGGLLITIGTLEYFTNAELKTFLTLARDGNWAIALLEPIGPLDDYQNFESVPRGNLAYSHNYEAIILAAGFSIMKTDRTRSRVPRVFDVRVAAAAQAPLPFSLR